MMRDESWIRDALCGGKDMEPKPGDQAHLRVAKKLCLDCPVRTECLVFAFDVERPTGVWGAATPLQLPTLRRAFNRDGEAALERHFEVTARRLVNDSEPSNVASIDSRGPRRITGVSSEISVWGQHR